MNKKKPHLRKAEQITVYFTRTERRALTDLSRAQGFAALAPYLASLARERLSKEAKKATAKLEAGQQLTPDEMRVRKGEDNVLGEQIEEVESFIASTSGRPTQPDVLPTLRQAVALLHDMNRDLKERDASIARLEATVNRLADQLFTNTKRKEKKDAAGTA